MKAIRRLFAWISERRHRATWQYGQCHGGPARRNRATGAVQFVMHPKGRVIADGYLGIDGTKQDYVYPEDYWVNFDSYWWPEFRADP